MRLMHFAWLAASLSVTASSSGPPFGGSNLLVAEVPDHVRPYVVRAYSLAGPLVGPQVYRFPVTGASSGGAFTLISTAAPGSYDLGVLPHQHQRHYENFFCLRGRFALWTEKYGNQQARILSPGDYGAIPEDTTHTFQLLDPVNEMVGVVAPGGFEELFYFLAPTNYSSVFNSPFPATINGSTPGGDPSIITELERFDVFAQLDFSPRRDLTDGTAPASSWHHGSNDLAPNATTPFFVASGYGPQYVTNSAQCWQIISPFITPEQSGGTFTEGVIALSQRFPGAGPAPTYDLTTHTALEVVQGQLSVRLAGETATLSVGDVVFAPAGVPFSYWTEVAYTNILYVGGGAKTLDQELLSSARPWAYSIFPNGTELP